MGQDLSPHFEIHPSLVYQLGESLISDAVQALIELVKNCYDADATYAKIIIDTQGCTEVDGAIYPSVGGWIIIEDNGHGMDIDDIEAGWLTISNRKKREMKQAQKTTPGGRTPLGDKGLGRLGVQRLGDNLEIFTKAKDSTGYHFGFSWLDFATAPNLESVNIHLSEFKYPRQHGSKVVVSDLKEPEFWTGEKAIKQLEKELSQMISPYRQIQDFTVMVEVDGKSLELMEVNDRIREIAPIRYALSFDGSQLIIQGRARLNYFRPANSEEADLFTLIAESDDGKAFFDFLQAQKYAHTISLTRAQSKQWFVKFQCRKLLSGLDKVQRLNDGNGDIANPGPFTGEIDSFDLGALAFKKQSVFDGIMEYRRHIKTLSGIRVYRDGFAIKMDRDWLKLGAQWTSASSYYGLKPDNTLGYIALSARYNMELEEKTDREGFKDSPYFRNFQILLEEFKSFTTMAQAFFGRSWAKFRKKRNEILAQVDSRKTIEAIYRPIKNKLTEAQEHKKKLDVFKTKLHRSETASKTAMMQLKSAKIITPELQEKAIGILSSMEALRVEVKKVIDNLSAYLRDLDSLLNTGTVLEDRINGLRRQMDDMYETVALGLTAEALSHEIYNVADQLAVRVKSAQTTLHKRGINDRPIFTFIEYVQSSIMALRKQMSFLSPSLRYVREQRHEVNIGEFIADLIIFYHDRFAKNKITMMSSYHDSNLFTIRMNKGKLTQIIDNLVLNSEYWLKEDVAQGRITSGAIILDVSRPFIRVFDDGIGIDPSIEHTLFEPFVSTKKQGRGLGLFIVKQLLDSEGCNISVLPERNQHKRLFKLQIEFRSVIHE